MLDGDWSSDVCSSDLPEKLPLYNLLFRLMHSIKGVSRTYGMNEFSRLAHMAEDILDKYRSNEISYETGMIDGSLASETLGIVIHKMNKLLKNGVQILHKVFNQGKENAASIRNRRRSIKIDEEKIRTLISYAENLNNDAGMGRDYLARKISGLVDNLFMLSLQPLDVVYNRLHQIVKDVASSLGKKARLVIEGEPLFLGPEAHHHLINSMIHLLRNAVDHGIEVPELRSELGKDPEGLILLKTSTEGEMAIIEIRDDGAGMDPQAIADLAVEKGFTTLETVVSMTDREKIHLILLPGFSSKDSVSEISGRGVGMDVVAETMTSLGGRLTLESILDEGTVIVLEFPPSKRSG
jgi:chemotaxis protein histidine kinase CheA